MQIPHMTTSAIGTIRYRLNGKYHREDGPAVIYPNGKQFWHLNGKCHRIDGPAIIHSDGTQIWYLNGKRHRLDGPAVTLADGTQEWWLNNRQYYFKDYCKKLKLSDEDIVFLKLKYNTCVST